VSQDVQCHGFIALLLARCYLETGLLLFLDLLIKHYEPAAAGLHKMKLLLVAGISGGFS
jgi:hypothetical protein